MSDFLSLHIGPQKQFAEKAERDWDAKKKVLSIYSTTCHFIEETMQLRHTSGFKFQVKTLEFRKKPKSDTTGRTDLLTGRVYVKYGKQHQNKALGSLPKKKCRAFVSFADGEPKIFTVHGNSRFRLDKASLNIDFKEGAKEDAVPPARLGIVTIPLPDIDRRCPMNGRYMARADLDPGPTVSKGQVEIEFLRSKADKEQINDRKESLIKALKDQIIFIKRFNQDFGMENVKLSANIRGLGNTTFLHAAITLQQEEMVKHLLDLGANPREKSFRYGTPIHHAMKFRDRALEKLQNLINNGQPASSTEPEQQVYDLYTRIFKLLKAKEEAQQSDDVVEILDDTYLGEEGCDTLGPEQRKREFEILQEIFSRAGSIVEDPSDSMEADYNFVSGMLRLHYSKECPDRGTTTSFLSRAIRHKLVVSISGAKLRLGAAQEASETENTNGQPLPETGLEWLFQPMRKCWHFEKRKRCEYDGFRGNYCRYAHVYHYPRDGDSRLVLESKALQNADTSFKMNPDHVKTLSQNGWFTAGYSDKKLNEFFYSDGGSGKANRLGVNW